MPTLEWREAFSLLDRFLDKNNHSYYLPTQIQFGDTDPQSAEPTPGDNASGVTKNDSNAPKQLSLMILSLNTSERWAL